METLSSRLTPQDLFFFFFLNPFSCTLGYIALCSTSLCPILLVLFLLSFLTFLPFHPITPLVPLGNYLAMRQVSWHLKCPCALEHSVELVGLCKSCVSSSVFLDRNIYYLVLAAVRMCCSEASSCLDQVLCATLRIVGFHF